MAPNNTNMAPSSTDMAPNHTNMAPNNTNMAPSSTDMAPDNTNNAILIREEDTLEKLVAQAVPRKFEIVWLNVVVFSYYHLAALYGLYLCFTSALWLTVVFACGMYLLNGLGVTAGVHRLWSHRTYKATQPLQVFLMLCQSLANQFSIVRWVREHRVHHKYCDTDADPHNATRGFFYSHIGWLLVKRHPEFEKRSGLIDLSDIYSNPIIMFQKRNELWLIPLMAIILPTALPIFFWNETLSSAYHINMLRYACGLNATFLINSAAHMWGWKPYDKHILPTQNIAVALTILGEGFHNYHHVFPQDYRAAELGNNALNFTTGFIDFCAWLGLAYDRRSVPDEVVQKRMTRTGDGTDLWANEKSERKTA